MILCDHNHRTGHVRLLPHDNHSLSHVPLIASTTRIFHENLSNMILQLIEIISFQSHFEFLALRLYYTTINLRQVFSRSKASD